MLWCNEKTVKWGITMAYQSNDSAALKHQPVELQNYIDSPEKQRKLYKRTLIIIVISQIFGGAGLAAGIAVGALLAQEMLGTDSLAGVPIALFTLGSAAAAFLVGRISDRFGRRIGLAIGFLTGGVGAVGVVAAAVINNIVLLFISLLIYGAGSATNLMARYAGTDLAAPKERATAVSIAMFSTTFGAVAGPNLIDVMGEFATSLGVPALSGPFILAAVAFSLAGIVLLLLLRPDPLIVAKAIAEAERNRNSKPLNEVTTDETKNKRGIIAAGTLMVLTQMVMFAVMTMTPVHMEYCGFGLKEVGMIIGFHIGAMFLPSPLTGILVDKLGRVTMAIASGVTLLAAGLLAAVPTGDSMILLTIALILLGLGWNFGLISGTAILVDSTNLTNRAKIQGSIDVLVALSGATGGVLSGMVVSYSSYAALSIGGGILSLLLIPVVIWAHKIK